MELASPSGTDRLSVGRRRVSTQEVKEDGGIEIDIANLISSEPESMRTGRSHNDDAH